MTCIVGFKSLSGDLFLAADSRISWRFRGCEGRDLYQDELQKLYFPSPNVVIAFATENLWDLRALLLRFTRLVQDDLQPSIESQRWNYRYNSWIRRLLHKEFRNINVRTDLLVGLSFPGHSNYNQMFEYTYDGHKVHSYEVQCGRYRVLGSVDCESSFPQFEEEVVRRSFNVHRLIDIGIHNGWFHANYVCFQEGCGERFQSIGEIFHSTYTRDGQFIGVSTDVNRIEVGMPNLAVTIEYDETDGSYWQVNHSQGRPRVRLLSIADHPLNYDRGESIFRVDP